MRGLILSIAQVQAAVLAVVADKRPEKLVFPAGVLCRASVEGLANLLALLDHPGTVPARLARDDYRHTRRMVDGQAMQASHLGKAIRRERRILRTAAKLLDLSNDEVANPESIQDFPSPGGLIGRTRRRHPQLELRGARRTSFEAIYDFWYAGLSAYSHQRLRALQVATACFDQDGTDEAGVDIGRTNAAVLATLTLLCALTEVDSEASGGRSHSLNLAAAWALLEPMNVMTKRVFEIRYRNLLPGGPRITEGSGPAKRSARKPLRGR